MYDEYDKKALKLLKKRYPSCSDEERKYCVKTGVVREYSSVTHDESVRRIKEMGERIPLEKAAKAFLYSVSSGDCRYRTALSSLIWAKALPEHEFSEKQEYDGNVLCKVCGGRICRETGLTAFDTFIDQQDRLFPNKVNMDVCRTGYVLNDLAEFEALPDMDFSSEDIRIINRIFGLAEEISPTNKVNALLKLIAAEKTIELSRANAHSVLGVLSACGFFDTPEHKSYRSGFVPCSERDMVYEADVYYPLLHWRGKYGINYAAADIFGENAELFSVEKTIRGCVERKELKEKPSNSAAEKHFEDGKHIVELDNRMRHYYGLAPLDPKWDREVRFSVTHSIVKRSEIFFDGDRVKKIIYEEKGGENGFLNYTESDFDTPTNGRRLIIPKTLRGREQPLTPSLLLTPNYMLSHLYVTMRCGDSGVTAFNCSNDQQLPLPHRKLDTAEDFYKYTECYIASCPVDYDRQLENYRNKKRVTVKFTAGDIFRIQITPTLYTYCLILCKVRQLLKWKEVPAEHPLNKVMTQPIMYRQYAIVTENPAMTAEELSEIPLLDMELAQDNEVLWETYQIVCSKKLTEDDIDLGFGVSTKLKTVVWGLTLHELDEEELASIESDKSSEIHLSFSGMTGKVSLTYGVAFGINYKDNGRTAGLIEKKETASDKQKKALAEFYGFGENFTADDFANRFGGMTRREFIELAEKRFKK